MQCQQNFLNKYWITCNRGWMNFQWIDCIICILFGSVFSCPCAHRISQLNGFQLFIVSVTVNFSRISIIIESLAKRFANYFKITSQTRYLWWLQLRIWWCKILAVIWDQRFLWCCEIKSVVTIKGMLFGSNVHLNFIRITYPDFRGHTTML